MFMSRALRPIGCSRCWARSIAPCGVISSYATNSKHEGERKQREGLHRNFNAKKKWSPNKQVLKQNPLRDLLDLKRSFKHTHDNTSPVPRLEALMRMTEKSIRQSYHLMSDSALIDGYRELLKEATDFLSSPTPRTDLVKCLLAVAKICHKQDVFLDLNETRISLHAEVEGEAMSCASVLPNEAVELYAKGEEIISTQGFNELSIGLLVDVAWSYAITQQSTDNFLNRLKEEILLRPINEFSEVELCEVLETFSINQSINTWDLFEQIQREILRRGLVGFQTQELVTVLFSFVSKDVRASPKLFHLVKTDLMTRDVRVLSPLDLSWILWSFATAEQQIKSPDKQQVKYIDLVKFLENEILRRGVTRFGDRGLAVVLWSLTEMNYFSKALLTLLKMEICKRNQRKFLPHDISIFLRSFAKVRSRFDSRIVFSLLDKELHHRGLSEFSSSEFAMTLWSLAEAGQGTTAVLVNFKKEVLAREIQEFHPVYLSQIIWSFAKVRSKVDVEDVFKYLGDAIFQGYDIWRLSTRQLALILWSFSVSGHIPEPLFKSLQEEALRRDLRECNNAILCQFLFSLAEGGEFMDGKLIKKIMLEVCRRDLGSFHHLQLATATSSIAHLVDKGDDVTPQLIHALQEEIQQRDLITFMPSDICRMMVAFTKFKTAGRLPSTRSFTTLTQELLRRGLSEFSCGELAMLLVSLSQSCELSSKVFQLFRDEILTRNSRDFSATHLSVLLRCLADQDAEDLLVWIEEEVISRTVTAFSPTELLTLLRVFSDVNRGLRVSMAIKEQLLSRRVYGYTEKDVSEICRILEENGVQTSDISSNLIA